MATASHADLAAAISAAAAAGGAGVLLLRGLAPGAAPLAAVRDLFDLVASRPELVERANAAYKRDKLIFKDTYATGKGGPAIDQKRVLDFSPARLDAVARVDPDLAAELGAPLAAALAFFEAVRTSEVPRIAAAAADAAGAPAIAGDALCNYRMVDYYQRAAAAEAGGLAGSAQPPRCGEHRDFGSFTLIFQDAVGGLEVFVPEAAGGGDGGSWAPIPAGGPGEAVLLFGWCTTFRSNGRVPAALHRVTSPPAAENPDERAERRRVSAVLFVAPQAEASLAPEVAAGEVPRFRGVAAGELRKEVGRKWQYREGTLTEEEMRAQAERLAEFPTQDAYIAHAYGL